MAVTNFCGANQYCESGTLTILVGNGDGTFSESPTGTAGYPTSVAVGDFNGDGIPDLAVTNYQASGGTQGDGTVTVLIGNGGGAFTPTVVSPATGNDPLYVAVGDFNGDGVPDLVVSNSGSNNLTVLLGNGDGTFTAAASPGVGLYPIDIAAGDLNGDGIPDLVVSNWDSSTLQVLLGKGNGTFSTTATIPTTGEGSQSFAVADLNGDGVPDIVAGVYTIPYDNPSAGGVLVLLTANRTATASDTAALPSDTEINQVLASYSGDSKYSAGLSDTAAGPITPTITVTPSSSTILISQPLPVTAVLNMPAGFPTPTGSSDIDWRSRLPQVSHLHTAGGPSTSLFPQTLCSIGSYPLTVSYTPRRRQSRLLHTEASGAEHGIRRPSRANSGPTLTLYISSLSITDAQALTATIAVNGGTGDPLPTGSVTLTGGGYTSAPATLSSGSAQIIVPAGSLANGSDSLEFTYTPDSSSAGVYTSAAAKSTVDVGLITPTVTVTPSPSSIATTQRLTVAVTVTGGKANPTATGSVTLNSGGYTSAAITLSSGSAQIIVPGGSLAAGSDPLTVNYAPDASSSSVYNSASGAGYSDSHLNNTHSYGNAVFFKHRSHAGPYGHSWSQRRHGQPDSYRVGDVDQRQLCLSGDSAEQR